MIVTNTHIVNHISYQMGTVYKTISKIYECAAEEGSEYFLESSGKSLSLKRITKEKFDKLNKTPFDEHNSIN